MSNRNQDADYGRPAQVMDFVADAILRRIRTAEPAMIEEYDSTTRRAKVKPLINAVKTDRTPLPRASIPDVPVLWPSAAGVTLHMPDPVGSTVLLIFTHRSLGDFKTSFSQSTPSIREPMALENAVAIAGFGSLEGFSPEMDGEWVVQKDDASASLRITSDGKIKIKGDVEIEGNLKVDDDLRIEGESQFRDDINVQGDIDVSGDVDGVDVSSHRHGGIQSGGSQTLPPA